MQVSHDNLKTFDSRVGVETKKAKEILGAFEKMQKVLEAERRAYCSDFSRGLEQLTQHGHFKGQFKEVLLEMVKQLREHLDQKYAAAIQSIRDNSCQAMGYLPNKLDNFKKRIKLADKQPDNVHKMKDFEFHRIADTKHALMHYCNAQMSIHAEALNLFAAFFERFEKLEEGQDVFDHFGKSPQLAEALKSRGYKVKM